MKLHTIATTYDICNANGKIIAQAYRIVNDCWLFRDFTHDWAEDSFKPLTEEELIPCYVEIRKRRNIARAVRKAKAKAAAARQDLPQGLPPKV